MLGVDVARSAPVHSSGHYLRKLITSGNNKPEQEKAGFMMLDFSNNIKSFDHIADSKEKSKSSSIERFKNSLTFKRKKRGSESEQRDSFTSPNVMRESTPNSGSAIEIPSRMSQSDYTLMDFNPSPRSNTSTSTNSDVPLSGYLVMRPGNSTSFSSTCSTEYVEMQSGTAVEGEYLAMSPTPEEDSKSASDITNTNSESTLTTGVMDPYVDMSCQRGLSVSIDSSSSSSLNSSRQRKISNTYVPHLPIIDMHSSLPEELQDKSYLHENDIRGYQKDNKSKKSQSRNRIKRKKSDHGDSFSEKLKSFTSSHGSLFGVQRKNSISSSSRTPLSPSGSPLPKASRNSSSPFASLTRSSRKNSSRECANFPSQSPPFQALTRSDSPGSQISPEFSRTLNPSYSEDQMLAEQGYCSMEPSSYQRNNSSKDLALKNSYRSSGSYDLSSNSLFQVGSSASNSSSKDLLASFRERARSNNSFSTDDGMDCCSSYVNCYSSSPSTITCNKICKPCCCVSHPQLSLSRQCSELGRVSESSGEDSKYSDPKDRRVSESPGESSYVNMCSGITYSSPQNSNSSISKDIKGLINEDNRRFSSISEDSDYFLMDPKDYTPENHVPSSYSAVRMRPPVPSSLSISCKPDPLTLQKLTIDEDEAMELCNHSGACPVPFGANDNLLNSGERCRSLSGPGAPEGTRLKKNSSISSSCRESHRKNDGENGKALSACSSPVSYSPPHSPRLDSSSKSSLSEGGMSSASSTCTVINVGILRGLKPTGSNAWSSNTDSISCSSQIKYSTIGSTTTSPTFTSQKPNLKVSSSMGSVEAHTGVTSKYFSSGPITSTLEKKMSLTNSSPTSINKTGQNKSTNMESGVAQLPYQETDPELLNPEPLEGISRSSSGPSCSSDICKNIDDCSAVLSTSVSN